MKFTVYERRIFIILESVLLSLKKSFSAKSAEEHRMTIDKTIRSVKRKKMKNFSV